MTAGELAQIITALAALVSALLSWRNSRKIEQVRTATEQVHNATNSMKDQLVAEVRASSHAEGVKEGRAAEREKANGEK